ncbi:MAG: hypothetical protein IPP77_09780 [Bacteroidetes bacterium]|nr:hypothetical protein [Bacteroidota bacterium]
MGYLLHLVNSFDENELMQFCNLELEGKEHIVRNEYASHQHNEKFDESALRSKLGLTKTHLDKINSILLDKVLTHIAGASLNDKFEFLAGKQLYPLILHKLKLGEKKLKQEKNIKSLKEFYVIASRMTMLFNYNDFPVKQMTYYCRSYKNLLAKEEVSARYRMSAKCEELLIHYYHARKDGTKKKDASLKRLLKLEQEVKDKKMYETEHAIYIGISGYYESVNWEKGLYYLKKAEAAAQKVYDKIHDRDKVFLISMIAQHLIEFSRYQDGVDKYKELFQEFPVLAGVRLYHPYQYVFALLIVKDLKGAEVILRKYIEPFLKNENARHLHFNILRLYAIYHLLNKDIEKAGRCLQQILQFGKENFTPLGDLLFRLVHNVYCVQKGDYVLAADVFRKNMKYIDSKLQIQEFTVYKKIFLALGKVIRFKSKADSSKKTSLLNNMEVGEGRERLYMDLIRLQL